MLDFTLFNFLYISIYMISGILFSMFLFKYLSNTFRLRKSKQWWIILLSFIGFFVTYIINYSLDIYEIIFNHHKVTFSSLLTSVSYTLCFTVLTINISNIIILGVKKYGKSSKLDDK